MTVPRYELCPQCLEMRQVKAVIGKLTRLDCKHLITTTLTEEQKEEKIAEVIQDIKAAPVIEKPAIAFDPNQFHNRKTKDTPYPFQIKGIQFAIEHAFKVLIADEQGLGKTVQALGILHYAMEHCYDQVFPCIVFGKSSTKIQWLIQALNWGGPEFLPQVIDDGKSVPILGFNVYISSYDVVRRFTKTEKVKKVSAWGNEVETEQKTNPFYDFPFKTVILDEVQQIKGDSIRTDEIKRIAMGKNIIALSGTPIKNNAAEYFTILNLLAPDKFPSKKQYLQRWVKVEVVNGYEKYTGLWNPARFAEYTKDIIIRRTREEVRDEIGLRVTKANRIFYHVDFENEKLKADYEKAEAQFIREMEKEVKKKTPAEVIGMLSAMRHLVGLNKIQPTADLAIEYLLENPQGKLLIFAHHKDVMSAIGVLLGQWCKDGGYALPHMFTSDLNQQQRFDIVSDFITPGPNSSPFMIGSTLAMAEGVDRLQTACNDCIVAERQWNPANEEQAESRLIRIGQMRSFVNATYPIASNTIDEYFTEIVETKRRAMKETLDGQEVMWDQESLLSALYDAIKAKGRKKLKKGW